MIRLCVITVFLCFATSLGAQYNSLELTAAKLSMRLEWGGAKVWVTSLKSLPSEAVLTSAGNHSLFDLKIRRERGKMYDRNSLTGWNRVEAEPFNGGYLFTFTGLEGVSGAEDLSVSVSVAEGKPGEGKNWYESSAITLTWGKYHFPKGFSLDEAVLLPLTFREFGTGAQAFYPYSSGIVCRPFSEKKDIDVHYPCGFGASMAWFALWDDNGCGVYVAAHDKTATMKNVIFNSDTASRKVNVAFRYPAENRRRNDSGFAPCRIVLTGFDGDWYDAAVLYRDWVRNESDWYPREVLTEDGRSDTPLWMRELSLWAIGSGENIEQFQEAFGIPCGLHWYNWHQIPFDNDYPHYFPAKPEFRERVAEIQRHGDIYIMPYINGRLWDRLDSGITDSLFTELALPNVTKQKNGNPCLETYDSAEDDGRNVYLGVMCPSTELWQKTLFDIVQRLVGPRGDNGNMGVDAVYLDQIAAAPPVECYDDSHGHSVGGGDWWVPAYGELLGKIRSALPSGRAITTESNADGYTDVFDGFLVWQFQHNGQVPAFAAVYGGAIQLFGRQYGGNVLSVKTRLAEQFVFGEQIGWVSANIIRDTEKLSYMKKIVSLRHKFREYFYKGEMSRPPRLSGNHLRLKPTWYFVGRPLVVSVEAVRSGAWVIPKQKKAILMFANSSANVQDLGLEVDFGEFGFSTSKLRYVRHNPDGSTQRLSSIPERLHFAPEEIFIIEIKE